MIQANDPDGAEPMRYGMLGDDTASTGEKLAKFTGDVDWAYLKPHFDSGVLLYVDPELALVEVGQAFAEDNKVRVEGWLKSGDLTKPSEPHAAYWEQTKARFTAMVVSPFVLVQPAES